MIRRRALPSLLVALLLVALPVVAAACGGDDGADETHTFTGYTREPTPSVAEVQLQLADGAETLAPTAEDGGLRIVYFGFTSCPDVCPTTMSDLKRAIAALAPEDQARVEVAVVTVDPDRDVPEKLDAYVTTFIPDGDAVRFDDPDALAAAAEAFGAQYRVTPGEGDGADPEVSHSADLYAVDDRGDLVMQWPFGVTWEDLRDDLAALLADIDLNHNEEST